jgi:hypothetical protein
MKLRSLGSLDPDVLAVLHNAFDDVWLRVERTVSPNLREATRDAIATALMQAAMAGERDPEKLWCHAMNRARALSTLDWMSKEVPPPLAPPKARYFRRLRTRRMHHRWPI